MTSGSNPWAEVFNQSKQKTTEGIIPFINQQVKMLSEASGGKVKGLFSLTCDVNRTLVSALDLAESASTVVSRIISAGTVHYAPDSDLKDASDLYKKNDYCFEIRSDRYRFRVFTIEFGPSYPAAMTLDRGMCKDLAKIYDRYKFEEAEPCNITIRDDDDLNRVFNKLLRSEKLIYICNRLMKDAKVTV